MKEREREREFLVLKLFNNYFKNKTQETFMWYKDYFYAFSHCCCLFLSVYIALKHQPGQAVTKLLGVGTSHFFVDNKDEGRVEPGYGPGLILTESGSDPQENLVPDQTKKTGPGSNPTFYQ